MSRKNKSKFGAGATGSISFNYPATSAPAPAATPSDPMRIAPPKKFMALGRVKSVAPVATAYRRAASPTALATHRAVSDAVSIVTRAPAEEKRNAVSDAISLVRPDRTSPAVSDAIALVRPDRASPAVTPSYDPERHGTTGGGGGGGGGSQQQEESPEPEARPAPQAAEADVWTPPSKTAMVLRSQSLPVLAPGAAPETKKGIFTRIWEFFFGPKKADAAAPKLLSAPAAAVPKVAGELDGAAESLVRRARLGDQNAMAIIDLVGKNAKKGVPAAIKARRLIAWYIQRNPVTAISGELVIKHGNLTLHHDGSQSQVSGEASVKRAATHIANGQLVTHRSVVGALSRFCTDPEKGAFLHGMRYPKKPTPAEYGSKVELAHRAGRAMALAGKIQNVRQPGSRISAFDPVIGWELGE